MADTLKELSDESLMERVQEHDHRAFSLLVERRSDMFYAASYRMVMNKEEAEDVVQEAFLKLWDRPTIWKRDKNAKFTTWFYKIVMNISLDKLRKRSKLLGLDSVESITSGRVMQEQEVILNEYQEALDKALQSLPEKQLMALNLCFYEGLSNKEAAHIMSISVKALESLLMRAKAGIKNDLHRKGILQEGDVA